MVKNYLRLIIVALVFATNVMAQSNWTTYDSLNSGLKNYYLNYITFDSQGNKWLATNDGIIKFDGLKWTTFNTSNSGISSNFIKKICIDSNGDKWIVTTKGLNKYDDSNWLTFNTLNSGLSSNTITSIFIDSENNVWLTTKGVLNKYNGTDWTKYKIPNSNSIIKQISIDSKGIKWLTDGYELYQLNDTTWTRYNNSNSKISGKIQQLKIDFQQNILLATDHGLIKFDRKNWIVYDTSNSNISGNFIGTLNIDLNNDIWLTCFDDISVNNGKGICKFDGTKWTKYDSINSEIANSYLSIEIDSKGNKWCHSFKHGLYKFSENKWTKYDTTNSWIKSNNIWGIKIDQNDDKWIITNKGLIKFTGDGNSMLCNIKNEIIESPSICDWAILTSKVKGINYKYKWSVIKNFNEESINNNLSQITINDYGKYILTMEDSNCFNKDTINIFENITPESHNFPNLKEIIYKSNRKCSNSNFTIYNPYDIKYKTEWPGISNANRDSIIVYNEGNISQGKYFIRVYDTVCQKSFRDQEIIIPFDKPVNLIYNAGVEICMVTNQNGKNKIMWNNVNENSPDENLLEKYKISILS